MKFGEIPSEQKRRETRKSEIRNIKKGQPTFSPKTGKRTVELAIPGLGRKRFAPATADALEYMARTYGVKDMSLKNAFEDPDFYGDIIAENRREMLRAKGISGKKMSGPGGRRLSPAEVLGERNQEKLLSSLTLHHLEFRQDLKKLPNHFVVYQKVH